MMKQALTDDDGAEDAASDSQDDSFLDVIRIMRLCRVQKKEVALTLFERLDLLDTLCEGDEDKLSEMLVTLKIDPVTAYQEIEAELMERLKRGKN
jgi:hypothetical protein